MPIPKTIKGLQTIRSMQNVVKSGIPNKEDSDFIKLYMFEKERIRLKNEELKISFRLEFIQNRLKEIQDYNNKKAEQMNTAELQMTDQLKTDFKTMSIEY
jgi:hypothetical protein